MMYATETVLALHRARVADELRARTPRAPRAERSEVTTVERARLRPAAAR